MTAVFSWRDFLPRDFHSREGKIRLTVIAIVTIVALATIVGFILDPRRAAASYLIAYATLLGIALGTLLLLMIVESSGGRWLEPLTQSALVIISAVVVFAVLFLPLVLFSAQLFPWIAPQSLAPALRDAVAKKAVYLAPTSAVIRAVIYWVVWIGLAELFTDALRKREQERNADTERRVRRLSAIGCILLPLTLTFAAFDWLMSLAPDWSASMYGLYFFAGASTAALATLCILLGLLPGDISPPHTRAETSNKLAKLLLTFLLLWIYFGYSQFLIIWIGDIPREIPFYAVRARAGWAVIGVALLAGHFVLPFLALLMRVVRRSAAAMMVVGAWLLVWHFVDIYWLAMPSVTLRLAPHWLDLTALLTIVALCVLGVALRRRREMDVDRKQQRLALAT